MNVSQLAIDDWRSALRLQEHFTAGHRATPVPGLTSPTGVESFARLDTTLDAMRGEPLALGSSNPATHAAARQWRPVATGTLWVLAERLYISHSGPDISLGWQGLTNMHTDPVGLVLRYGTEEFRLGVHCPNWLLVLVMQVGFGVTTELTPPSWTTLVKGRTP